ncbi:MAG: hypothetical protein RL669_298 [Pseudomonadota bacterium]
MEQTRGLGLAASAALSNSALWRPRAGDDITPGPPASHGGDQARFSGFTNHSSLALTCQSATCFSASSLAMP